MLGPVPGVDARYACEPFCGFHGSRPLGVASVNPSIGLIPAGSLHLVAATCRDLDGSGCCSRQGVKNGDATLFWQLIDESSPPKLCERRLQIRLPGDRGVPALVHKPLSLYFFCSHLVGKSEENQYQRNATVKRAVRRMDSGQFTVLAFASTWAPIPAIRGSVSAFSLRSDLACIHCINRASSCKRRLR